MKRLRLFLLTFSCAALALGLGTHQAAAYDTYYGDGLVHLARMPWLAGTTEVLTNGWGGCYGGYSHCSWNPVDRYGTDWGPAGGGTFAIYAVTEGDATCANLQDGWGFRVIVNRRNNGVFYDRYAHLPSCPWSSGHVEQGDFISYAGDTGGGTDIHLHYQVENASGASQEFGLSGHTNFCDHTISGFCTGNFAYDRFVSDNAGPGLNAFFTWVRDRIWFSYYAAGHYGPDCQAGEQAWDCVGSSIQLVPGYGPMAFRYTHHGDPAWHQWFLASDGAWHGMNLPDACDPTPYAYVVPGDYFIAWFFNADQLGQARSSVRNVVPYGSRCDPNIGCIQSFRYGALWSNAYGQNPIVLPPEYGSSTCGE